MAKFSLIIPMYNSEKTLERCLNSICTQSFDDFECILVDDGSTDGTLALAKRYVEKDPRFLLAQQNHARLSAARNLGISMATAPYVTFIDSDDELLPGALENYMRALDAHPDLDLVLGSFQCNENFPGQAPEKLWNKVEFILDFILKSRGGHIYGVVWNKVYRMEILRQHSLTFNENVVGFEDSIFNYQYYSYCEQIYTLEKPVYYYYYVSKSYDYIKMDRFHVILLLFQGFDAFLGREAARDPRIARERDILAFRNILKVFDRSYSFDRGTKTHITRLKEITQAFGMKGRHIYRSNQYERSLWLLSWMLKLRLYLPLTWLFDIRNKKK